MMFVPPSGVALLANAPERMPERKKRGREKDTSTAESRPVLPVASSGGKLSSRAARQRVMAQREEQLAAQKVSVRVREREITGDCYCCSLWRLIPFIWTLLLTETDHDYTGASCMPESPLSFFMLYE